jgi:malonyl-CoA decarboxylase
VRRVNRKRLLTPRRAAEVGELCRRLLGQSWESSALATAATIASKLSALSVSELDSLLEVLSAGFNIDEVTVESALARWRARGRDVDSTLGLQAAVESPRREIFRRINMAPAGIGPLIRLRARLLDIQRERPHLRNVDLDLRHVLASAMSRGSLRLEAVDWHTSAALLEKLMEYESVHAMRGWPDLRRRLAPDRRCFAFFHPAMPAEPLIFVEVALTRGMPRTIATLVDVERKVEDAHRSDTAVFFSINQCQPGLRGISLGNFLIRSVTAELTLELPGIKTFGTLSPVPGLAGAIKDRGDPGGFTDARLKALIHDAWPDARRAAGTEDAAKAAEAVLLRAKSGGETGRAAERLVLAYLTKIRRGTRVLDSVANFHLSNGARVERINYAADLSEKGIGESFGVMINYLYDGDHLEANHHRYETSGEVAMPRGLAGHLGKVQAAWAGRPEQMT